MQYKSPDDVLSFVVDWTNEIGGSTISTSAFTLAAGITLDSESNASTTSTATISGGTAGNTYRVQCQITTVAGETLRKELFLRVRRQLID